MVNGIIKGINKVVAVPFNAINGLLNKIRNVSVVGVSPFKSFWKQNPLKVPQIPLLYEGAVLKKGQVGLLEGKGDEAVVPLHNNRKWIRRVAAEFRSQLANTAAGINATGAGASTGGGVTYVFNQYNNSPKALSRAEIYRQTKNQLRFATHT